MVVVDGCWDLVGAVDTVEVIDDCVTEVFVFDVFTYFANSLVVYFGCFCNFLGFGVINV